MSKNEILAENLLALMTGEHSRTSFEDVVADFPMERINDNLPNADYTPWHLLEHIRFAQEDILDYMRNPEYKYRKWPDDYWPPKGKKATKAAWTKSVRDFQRDFKDVADIVKDPKTDFYKDIPWGKGETILREIVTLAKHNAFHLGEFAIIRQAMGTWGKGHKD
jgi:hypothetical protein